MDILCLILFLSVVALWFFANEYGTLSGVYMPTCAMSGRGFNWLVFVTLLASLWFSGVGAVEDALLNCLPASCLDCRSVMLMLLSSLIVLVVLNLFAVRGSVIYALLGALAAYGLLQDGTFDFKWRFILSFAAAPVMAFVLSALIRKVFKTVFSRVNVHMMKMSHYMRHAVIFCIVLTPFALGLNWGGLLCGIGDMILDERTVGISVMAVVGVIMFLFMQFGKEQGDEPSGMFADFSIYVVVSVGFSVALVLLFFSFETSASLVGLSPVPLSVSSLVFAAIAGAEAAQKSRVVDNMEYIREGIAFFASPICAFVLTYILFYIIGGESSDHMTDFVVMTAATLILVTLVFAGYIRMQRRSKEAVDKLVATQQQQIYEHSRALGDMELKVVMSENQALHNAVEMKRQEVMNVALSIVEQKEYLESLSALVKKMSKTADEKERDRLLAEMDASLKQRISYDRDVDSQYFYAQAETLHEDFNAKLSENFPDLTQQEKRLATLLRLGFSSKYIATLMNITTKSVEIGRYRLRQKLGLSKGDNLVRFIKSI